MRLCNQHPIEWIPMGYARDLHVWQVSIGGGVSWGDRKQLEAFSEKLFDPAVIDFELAKRCFDRDLEEGARTE